MKTLTRQLPSNPKRDAGAFTLIELLVTIAVIAVLAGILLPTLSSAKKRARTAECISNMRQFGLGFQLYAADHDGAILPNRDGPYVPLGETWVEGWLGIPGPDCTNTLYLRRSLLGKYVIDDRLWRCPASREPSVAGVRMPRLRTFSLSGFMGAPATAPARVYQRLSEIVRPGPSDALVFVEERIDTVNDGTFAMQWDFDPSHPEFWLLRDKPAVLHGGGANLAYADGHVAVHHWRDARTINAPRNDAAMPNNLDIAWLQEHGTSRER